MFCIIDESETRFFMKNQNEKKSNDIIKANLFVEEVNKISEKYGLEYIFITEGAKDIHCKSMEKFEQMKKEL